MVSLRIQWTNKESKDYVDILPMSLFHSEVEHREVEHQIRTPNGVTYGVKSSVDVKGNIATLTYRQTNNRRSSISPGVTRITFKTDERKQVSGIEWQDEGDINFVDPSTVFSLENDQRFFVIKCDEVEIRGSSLLLYGHSIKSMSGDDISLGDRVFVWLFENKGGRGIEWYGAVQHLDKSELGAYGVRLDNLHNASSNFGTNEINEFRNSSNTQEVGLFKKLKEYAHSGIRRIEQEEAERLLSVFSFGMFETAGQNEVARLARLGNISTRPNQAAFSTNIRRAYGGKCAFTSCATAEALQAAHIRVSEGQDDNDLRNGILLRADIHALFDSGLIALSLDGSRIDISAELSDPSYGFLRTVEVSQPQGGGPSEANIRHHRLRFGFLAPSSP